MRQNTRAAVEAVYADVAVVEVDDGRLLAVQRADGAVPRGLPCQAVFRMTCMLTLEGKLDTGPLLAACKSELQPELSIVG